MPITRWFAGAAFRSFRLMVVIVVVVVMCVSISGTLLVHAKHVTMTTLSDGRRGRDLTVLVLTVTLVVVVDELTSPSE